LKKKFFCPLRGLGVGSNLLCGTEPAAREASVEKILFWNQKSRKKYSPEKQLEINHTAGSVLPNAREWPLLSTPTTTTPPPPDRRLTASFLSYNAHRSLSYPLLKCICGVAEKRRRLRQCAVGPMWRH
jgi:hypothetical protein